MKRKPLIWRLYPSYLVITVLSLFMVTWYAVNYMGDFYYQETITDLEIRATLLGHNIEPLIADAGETGDLESLNEQCIELGQETGTRVTVVLASGEVICDSEESPARMDNHSDRPEIEAALAGRTGSSIRYSYTLETNLMYVAIPLPVNGGSAVIRTSIPVSSLDTALKSARVRIALGTLLAMALASIVSLLVTRRIVLPLREMTKGVERFASGDLSARLPIPETDEFAVLAVETNSMAARLDERMKAIVNQRNELEAILASMVEGVIAFDGDDRIIIINGTAADLLRVDPEKAAGRSVQEAVRNADLQDFIRRLAAAPSPVEDEITLYADGKKYIQVHGTHLEDLEGKRIGGLLVMNDLTRIRDLETIRKDFVANASHEIRTPVTAIKGFIETLLDGAMDDPEVAIRFLGIIGKHSDRLNAIVEDLLNLSRIEREAESGEVLLEDGNILEVVAEAVEACREAADRKDITLRSACREALTAPINRSLLVQALINLIDNAIKYSGQGQDVLVKCQAAEAAIAIKVVDNGRGIPPEHLPRLFERFYRVDKARSRDLGGTGLGLAIVKHILQAHNGEVSVTSTPGKGSTFTITLPA